MSPPSAELPVRLVHLSDIHVTVPDPRWKLSDWISKRATGLLNWRWFGRGIAFARADSIVRSITEEVNRHPPDAVVFSGDATALGFEEEFAHAAGLFHLEDRLLSGVAVPGNHDYYIRRAAAGGMFEKHFARWQQGIRVDDLIYPFAWRAGPVWLIAVNSSTGNRWPWDATGRVGVAQLARLQTLMSRLDDGPRILVTHYPYCSPAGKCDRRHRRLRDAQRLAEIAVGGKVCLWLHGHCHRPFRLRRSTAVPIPVICAGSATETGKWSFGEYTIRGREFHAIRKEFDPGRNAFVEVETFELDLSAL
jgi:3',5'-cyclic AMP phosphodiesterase CpdA